MSSCTISERKLSNCSRKAESLEDSCCHTRSASVLGGWEKRGGEGRGKGGGREGERRERKGGEWRGREKEERKVILYNI